VKIERSRQARWLGVVLTITAIGVAACGGDDGDAAGTTAVPSIERGSTADGEAGGEPILIKTDVTFRQREVTGEVLGGSTIGDSPFCPGGTFRDRHGNEDIGLVDRTFVCPDGGLRIGFTPGVPQGRTQSGPWKVLSGTGAFEGLQGQGRMEIKYERGSDTKGSETFTGTVAH
jgi:hypothetical protein